MMYLKNSSWMLFEQVLKLISALVVGIYIARYVGPQDFGILSYALSLVAIFMAISRIGFDSILVREISINNTNNSFKKAYISTAFYMMLLVAIICFSLLILFLLLSETDHQLILYAVILSIGLFTQVFLVIDYSFQGEIKAKYSSIAKSLALLIGAITKFILVFKDMGLFWLVVAYAFEYVLIGGGLTFIYFKKKNSFFFSSFDKSLVRPLLKSAWPMLLTSVAAILLIRVDQIMIKNILGIEYVGLYSSATRLYEGWLVLPFIISMSLLPAIIALKSKKTEFYIKKLTTLFIIIFWPSVIVAIFSSVYGRDILVLLYGESYTNASGVFILLMWTAPFASLGGLTARYLTVEKMEKKIAFRTLTALAINVSLNYFLIPIYGIEGAAISTLVSTISANYIVDYFDKELIILRKIKNNALILSELWR